MRLSELEQGLLHPPRHAILDSDRLVRSECECVGLGVHVMDDVFSAARGLSEPVQQFVVEWQQVVRVHARIVPHARGPRPKGPGELIRAASNAGFSIPLAPVCELVRRIHGDIQVRQK